MSSQTNFSDKYIELTNKVATLEANLLSLTNQTMSISSDVKGLLQVLSKVEGVSDSAIPALKEDFTRLVTDFSKQKETAEIYHAQIRTLANKLEQLEERSDLRDDEMARNNKRMEDSLDTKASKDSVESCYRWVYGGFFALLLTFLAWVGTIIGKFFGVN